LTMPELYIGTFALAPIIVALIQVAKHFGMPVKYAPWLNMGLAIVGFVIVAAIAQYPEFQAPVVSGLIVLTTFLAAAGFYDRGQAIVAKG